MKLSALLFSILLLSGCSSGDKEPPEIVRVQRVEPYHIVSEGDTVESVSKRYGMTRADVIKLNSLEPPYQLYHGQRLIVNVKASALIELPPELPQESDETRLPQEDITIDDIPQREPVASLPTPAFDYVWPIDGGAQKVSQHFGDNDEDGGVIFDASAGTPVKSIADGTVMIAGTPKGDAAAYGTTVVIKHVSKKTMSIYAMLQETGVTVGQRVKQGDIIGKVGRSGTIAKKPQLYFEISDLSGNGRKAVNPEKLLSK
ncbi:MAG: M23 family metallopeptidase [Holosporales bacterium]|jgi:lipoprotein NlpD|nr:M23 family metallopeptidase [Holosporales bacterium]